MRYNYSTIIQPTQELIDNIEFYMHGAVDEFRMLYVKEPSLILMSRTAVAAWKLAMRHMPDVGMFHHFRGIAVTCDPSQVVPVRAIGTATDGFASGWEVRMPDHGRS